MRPVYASEAYARAFGLGVVDCPAWRTALVMRPIPMTPLQDALGCYPLAAIDPAADLRAGLDQLRQAGAVSVALVPDPLMAPGPEALAEAFDVCRPFKTHYLIDRSLPIRFAATHRRWVRKASAECEVRIAPLGELIEPWTRLYAGLVSKRDIKGASDFPPGYFPALSRLDGVTAIAALNGGEIVAMALWVLSDEAAYYHLGASSEPGYDLHAAYGIMAAALDAFADRRLFHLGGAAGLIEDPDDGLARFKRGFSNRTVTAHFCGARLDRVQYEALAGGRSDADFFPAYRPA